MPCRSRSKRRQVAVLGRGERGAAVRDPPLGGLGDLLLAMSLSSKLARKRSPSEDDSGRRWLGVRRREPTTGKIRARCSERLSSTVRSGVDLLRRSPVVSYEGVGRGRMAWGSEKEEAAIVALGARTSSRDAGLRSCAAGYPRDGPCSLALQSRTAPPRRAVAGAFKRRGDCAKLPLREAATACPYGATALGAGRMHERLRASLRDQGAIQLSPGTGDSWPTEVPTPDRAPTRP
jgi:hypothetical protein